MNQLSATQIDELLGRWPGATVYLVGAGGCGMSGLGHLFLDLGFQVAGSDLVVNQEIRQLQSRGALIHFGHAAPQVDAARPVLVVYSPAVPAGNPELIRARELGLPVVRRALALAALFHRQPGICVAGMHGKTTTSALLAYALERLGAQPSYAIGWLVPQLERHARFTRDQPDAPFVIEADESDGTLREFRPRHAIILNVDEEHLDHYENFAAVRREFADFAAQVAGTLVYCADDEHLSEMATGRIGTVSYGYHPLADYRIEQVVCPPAAQPPFSAALPSGPQSCFEVWHHHRRLGQFSLPLAGGKNISNAAAVVALLHDFGHAPQEIAAAIGGFRGAARRQQELFRDARFAVYDDYGHHPNEILATLHALRSFGPRRLLVAFQPHRYTRTQHLLAEFGACFKEADWLWLMEIYPASEAPIPGVSSGQLAREIGRHGQVAEVVADGDELRRQMRDAMQPGDLVLFLGAGADVSAVAHALAGQLRAESERPRATAGDGNAAGWSLGVGLLAACAVK